MSDTTAPGEKELRALVEACRTVLARGTNERVKVAASVLDDAGQIFTAVQVRSSNCGHRSICAEAIAIWSPCGSCRELLRDHFVRYVVADSRGRPRCVLSTDLLPWP